MSASNPPCPQFTGARTLRVIAVCASRASRLLRRCCGAGWSGSVGALSQPRRRQTGESGLVPRRNWCAGRVHGLAPSPEGRHRQDHHRRRLLPGGPPPAAPVRRGPLRTLPLARTAPYRRGVGVGPRTQRPGAVGPPTSGCGRWPQGRCRRQGGRVPGVTADCCEMLLNRTKRQVPA